MCARTCLFELSIQKSSINPGSIMDGRRLTKSNGNSNSKPESAEKADNSKPESADTETEAVELGDEGMPDSNSDFMSKGVKALWW